MSRILQCHLCPLVSISPAGYSKFCVFANSILYLRPCGTVNSSELAKQHYWIVPFVYLVIVLWNHVFNGETRLGMFTCSVFKIHAQRLGTLYDNIHKYCTIIGTKIFMICNWNRYIQNVLRYICIIINKIIKYLYLIKKL